MSRHITSADKQRFSNTARSDWRGGLQLAAHLALLVAMGLALNVSIDSWFVVPVMTGYGIVLVALFAPLHETVHRTAFRTRALNDVVAMAIGFLHFLPAGHFRLFHGAHHRHVQDPKHDPELAMPKPSTRAEHLWALSTAPYWRSRVCELVDHARGQAGAAFIPQHAEGDVIREARWHFAGWSLIVLLSIAFGWTWPLTYWLLPTLLGQPFLRLYLLAEHGDCPFVPDVQQNTRSVRSNAVVRFLMWNMPYHIEHHAMPGAPFHRLPLLCERFTRDNSARERGYFVFHQKMWNRLARIDAAKRLR